MMILRKIFESTRLKPLMLLLAVQQRKILIFSKLHPPDPVYTLPPLFPLPLKSPQKHVLTALELSKIQLKINNFKSKGLYMLSVQEFIALILLYNSIQKYLKIDFLYQHCVLRFKEEDVKSKRDFQKIMKFIFISAVHRPNSIDLIQSYCKQLTRFNIPLSWVLFLLLA